MANELITVKLELIAAKAKQLAMDYKAGRMWEGDLERGLSELNGNLNDVSGLARTDR